MFPLKKLTLVLLFGLITLTACTTKSTSQSIPATATQPPRPTVAVSTVVPAPSSPSDSILWDDLQVTMDQLEITNEYVTDFGSTRTPPAGTKFLWVHVQLKNIGQVEMDIPVFEHYSILYAGTEIKPIYGHRNGYVDYTTLGTTISPRQELDGWLRFDIPVAAELREMYFVFLPESVQIGSTLSSPNYPYSNKPTYVWKCGP
jgi:hypothetical protein